MRWFFLLATIAANVAANYLLKKAAARPHSSSLDMVFDPVLLTGIGFAGLTLIFYTFSLIEFPLSIAYPIVTTTAFAGVFFVSWWALGEQFNAMGMVGAGLVLSGVILMALSTTSGAPVIRP